MRGRKDRAVALLIQVSLAQLVPVDHCYRHHDQSRDLSFVRELVAPFYAAGDRPASAHPAAGAEIGCKDPAAPRGPVRVGLGQRNAWAADAKRSGSSVELVQRTAGQGGQTRGATP